MVKKIAISLYILVVAFCTEVMAENWYPNTFDDGFINDLIDGKLYKKKKALKNQLDKMIEFDIQEDNFPYSRKEVYSQFKKIIKNGVSDKLKDNYEREIHSYVLFSLLAPGIVSDIQYKPANQSWVAGYPVDSGSIHYILSKIKSANLKLSILSQGRYHKDYGWGQDYDSSPLYPKESCLKSKKFGTCIYDYIIFTAAEVKSIKNELMSLQKGSLKGEEYNEFFEFILNDIFGKSATEGKALVFYAYD